MRATPPLSIPIGNRDTELREQGHCSQHNGEEEEATFLCLRTDQMDTQSRTERMDAGTRGLNPLRHGVEGTWQDGGRSDAHPIGQMVSLENKYVKK